MPKCYVKLPKTLVKRLFEWHGGQRSAVYSIASRANAGLAVDRMSARRAVAELHGDASYYADRGLKKHLAHAKKTADMLEATTTKCILSARKAGRKGRAKRGLGKGGR